MRFQDESIIITPTEGQTVDRSAVFSSDCPEVGSCAFFKCWSINVTATVQGHTVIMMGLCVVTLNVCGGWPVFYPLGLTLNTCMQRVMQFLGAAGRGRPELQQVMALCGFFSIKHIKPVLSFKDPDILSEELLHIINCLRFCYLETNDSNVGLFL